MRLLFALTVTLMTAQIAAAQVVGGVSGGVVGGQVVAQPRDRPNGPPPMPTGTATIKGHVVDAQSGNGLPRARVRLNWRGPGIPRQPVTTDDTGAFSFTGLPAGTFLLMSDRATYLGARYPETTQTLRSAASGLTLADGQTLEVRVPMYHGAAITGRVVDRYGDPVEFAQIQAMRLPSSGRGTPQQRGGTNTNDLGEYRLARLEPGRYLIVVQAQRRELFTVAGPLGAPPEPAPGTIDMQPLPTFYPGVLAIDEAQPVALERGMTAAGVDIALLEGETVRISGSVVDAQGQPVSRGGGITIRPILKNMPNVGGIGTIGGQIGQDGTFQTRVPPGEYELQARMPQMQNGRPLPGNELFASVRLNVGGDVSGVVLQLGPGARIAGRVVFEGDKPLPSIPVQGNGPPVVTFTSQDGSCRSGQATVQPDWTFTVEGVFGVCSARQGGGFGQWAMKGIVYDGKDILDQPITFSGGERMRDVEIVMTDKPTELALHVTDDQGAPTRDYVALAFSTDKTRWTTITGGSRYTRPFVPPPDVPAQAQGFAGPGLAGPNQPAGGAPAGAFVNNASRRETIVGLPAGDYFVVALEDAASDAINDADFLEQLSRGAQRVTLAYGSPASVTLKRRK